VEQRDRFPDKESRDKVEAEVALARRLFQRMIDRGREK